MKNPFQYREIFSRGAEVEFAWKDLDAVGYLGYLYIGPPGVKQIGQKAFMLRRKMLHEDDRKTEFLRKCRQKALEGVEAASRSAYPHNGERGV